MKSIITLFLLTISIFSQAQSSKEIFDFINEYRTEVLTIQPLLYNDSAQVACDARVKEVIKKFKARDKIVLSSSEIIMETKYYDAILEKALKDKDYELSERSKSICISLIKKGKTFYCVVMIWEESKNSLGVTHF